MERIFETVKEVLVEELGCEEEIIMMDSNIIEDLEADSLSVMEVVMNLEEEYEIEVEEEDIKTLKTVGDVVRYIDRKL